MPAAPVTPTSRTDVCKPPTALCSLPLPPPGAPPPAAAAPCRWAGRGLARVGRLHTWPPMGTGRRAAGSRGGSQDVHQPVLNGVDHQLGGLVDAKRFHDVGTVHRDGIDT